MSAARRITPPPAARCLCGAAVEQRTSEKIAQRLEAVLLDAPSGSPGSGVPPGSAHYAYGYLSSAVAYAVADLRALCGPCREKLRAELLEKGRLP